MNSLRKKIILALICCSVFAIFCASYGAWIVFEKSLRNGYYEELWLHVNHTAILSPLPPLDAHELFILKGPPVKASPIHFSIYNSQSKSLLGHSQNWHEKLALNAAQLQHGTDEEITVNGDTYRVIVFAIAEHQRKAARSRGMDRPPMETRLPPLMPKFRYEELKHNRDQRKRPAEGAKPEHINEHYLRTPAPADAEYILVFYMDQNKLHNSEQSLVMNIIISGTAALALTTVLSIFIQRSLIKPIQSIDAHIEKMVPGDITTLVHLKKGVPAELRGVVQQLTNLNKRIEELLIRERRTTGDIAHELRTPLAALRSGLSFTLMRHANDPQLAQSEQMVEALERRIDALLLLARLTDNIDSESWIQTDLTNLAQQAWIPLQDIADQRGIHLALDQSSQVIRGHQELLDIMLANALGNAVSYADLDSTIYVSTAEDNEYSSICIRNTCTQLDDGDYQHAFDPLWRADHARSNTEQHAGLGMTLIARIAQAHGGHVSARVADHTFILTVHLPNAAQH